MMDNAQHQEVNDFNIHGLVSVRYVGAPPGTAVALASRLGTASSAVPIQEPDIIVHFDLQETERSLTYVGSNSAAFTEDNFYLLNKVSGAVEARIPFEQIGTKCEIHCPQRVKTPPLLFDIINLTFLSKGYVPLHAAAFTYNDLGILIAGWPKGGKTAALLAFMNQGAKFLSDEWVLVSKDGCGLLAIPTSVTISEWQFKHVPALLPPIGKQEQLLFAGIHLLDGVHERFGQGRLKQSLPIKMLRKGLPSFKRQLRISKSPNTLFPDQVGTMTGRLDKLFLIMNHSDPEITIEPLDPVEMVMRMVHANEYEMRDFFDYYSAFRFAFPNLQNDLLEEAFSRQSILLDKAFAGKDAYILQHPYGKALETLFVQMEPFCVRP